MPCVRSARTVPSSWQEVQILVDAASLPGRGDCENQPEGKGQDSLWALPFAISVFPNIRHFYARNGEGSLSFSLQKNRHLDQRKMTPDVVSVPKPGECAQPLREQCMQKEPQVHLVFAHSLLRDPRLRVTWVLCALQKQRCRARMLNSSFAKTPTRERTPWFKSWEVRGWGWF